jgi:hypothetical protein
VYALVMETMTDQNLFEAVERGTAGEKIFALGSKVVCTTTQSNLVCTPSASSPSDSGSGNDEIASPVDFESM